MSDVLCQHCESWFPKTNECCPNCKTPNTATQTSHLVCQASPGANAVLELLRHESTVSTQIDDFDKVLSSLCEINAKVPASQRPYILGRYVIPLMVSNRVAYADQVIQKIEDSGSRDVFASVNMLTAVLKNGSLLGMTVPLNKRIADTTLRSFVHLTAASMLAGRLDSSSIADLVKSIDSSVTGDVVYLCTHGPLYGIDLDLLRATAPTLAIDRREDLVWLRYYMGEISAKKDISAYLDLTKLKPSSTLFAFFIYWAAFGSVELFGYLETNKLPLGPIGSDIVYSLMTMQHPSMDTKVKLSTIKKIRSPSLAASLTEHLISHKLTGPQQ